MVAAQNRKDVHSPPTSLSVFPVQMRNVSDSSYVLSKAAINFVPVSD